MSGMWDIEFHSMVMKIPEDLSFKREDLDNFLLDRWRKVVEVSVFYFVDVIFIFPGFSGCENGLLYMSGYVNV